VLNTQACQRRRFKANKVVVLIARTKDKRGFSGWAASGSVYPESNQRPLVNACKSNGDDRLCTVKMNRNRYAKAYFQLYPENEIVAYDDEDDVPIARVVSVTPDGRYAMLISDGLTFRLDRTKGTVEPERIKEFYFTGLNCSGDTVLPGSHDHVYQSVGSVPGSLSSYQLFTLEADFFDASEVYADSVWTKKSGCMNFAGGSLYLGYGGKVVWLPSGGRSVNGYGGGWDSTNGAHLED
jgi:hypothetical protein